MSRIRIGTSGWSYPAGDGSWNGVFYPAKGHRPRGFDELTFYARYFNTVEVNSSFYRTPTAEATQKWVDRTPSGFEFSLKLYQKFTHPGMFLKAVGDDASSQVHVDQDDVDLFMRAIDPIRKADKLGALLMQFPASFKSRAQTQDYLAWLLGAFAGCPVAVELRHSSWSDDGDRTRALLGEHGAAWTQIDEPKFRFSIRQDFRPNVRSLAYVRLHGRNAAKWFHHDRSEERYDYLYSHEELAPVVEQARASTRAVRKLYLYLNNHFAAKAVVNAVDIKQQLGDPIDEPLPDALVERYPAMHAFGRRDAADAPAQPKRSRAKARAPDLFDTQ